MDRRGDALGGCAGALRVRRGRRLEPRPRRRRGQDHRAHPGPGHHQPQQPHGCGVQQGGRGGPGRHRPAPRAGRVLRRDLREDPVRGRRAPPRGARRRRRRAVPDLQRPVQGLPGLRLPGRLGADLGPPGGRDRLHRGSHPDRQHADVRQRARPARHPDRARRLPVDRGADRARGALLRAVDAGRPDAQRDPRGQLRTPPRCAVLLPAAGPRGVPDRGRRGVRDRAAARQEDPGHPRHRVQLGPSRPLPPGHAARRGRAGGGDRPDRRLPGRPTLVPPLVAPSDTPPRPHHRSNHRA
ncbi:hypothetical protein NOCARDAX2BIS_10011 [Nocardioides sp. AX2bis]|nr:hypothetical protein NOCARDAX2BIS_10011 [Nocardioides sp. AX2bis]